LVNEDGLFLFVQTTVLTKSLFATPRFPLW